jgi:hypothetical protein
MTESERLRYARNVLLSLHKSMIDFEKAAYESVHGQTNPVQFLNLLLEDESFSWLRKFSILIVEIDEMFDLKDGITNEMVRLNLSKICELVAMQGPDEFFRAKYLHALQNDADVARNHEKLEALLDATSRN